MKKKLLSIMLVLSMVSASLFNGSVSLAAGWADYVNESIEVDTSYEESITQSDYKDQQNYYYDVFKVTIPDKGNIKVYVESANQYYLGGYNYTAYYYFYKTSDVDNHVWQWNPNGNNRMYSSARDRYYNSSVAVLSKGTYYFVVKSRDSDIYNRNIPYTFELDYSPSISAPTVRGIKSSKTSIALNWNKVSNADGYEIKYSTNPKLKGAQKLIMTGINSTSARLKGLSRKTTYYIKVRSKRTMAVSGQTKTYSSGWSTKKIITTK